MDLAKLSEVAKNLGTVVAICLGGAWTYLLFVKQRLGYPRLHTKTAAEVFDSGDTRLVRVEVVLENVGTVIVKLRNAELRLRKVVPFPSKVATAVSLGYDPVPVDQQQIMWPMLAGRQWAWKPGELEIEPGETEALHAEFFVEESLELIEFYLFVGNARKRRKRLGWSMSQVWPVPRKGVATVSDEKTVEKPRLVPLQERQEKQQVAQQPQQQVQPRQPEGQQQGSSEPSSTDKT